MLTGLVHSTLMWTKFVAKAIGTNGAADTASDSKQAFGKGARFLRINSLNRLPTTSTMYWRGAVLKRNSESQVGSYRSEGGIEFHQGVRVRRAKTITRVRAE